jgi:transglutaminase-like putative cysteine protease
MLQDLLPGLIDQAELDWDRIASVRYLIRQSFRYEYEAPIRGLEHRLMIVPPDRYGDQRTVMSNLSVTPEGGLVRRLQDPHGNAVVEIQVPGPLTAIEFDAWVAIDRTASSTPLAVPIASRWAEHPGFLEPSGLTDPGRYLRKVAAELSRRGLAELELAESVNEWVHDRLEYRHGATDIHTTAAEAARSGSGVCQDYAHVMLSLCRLLALPARYVSGHLLGEGGTHAWVEVLLAPEAGGGAGAHGFDPTHGRRTSVRYVTVAVGRDYRDVAPTSGTYRGGAGRLTTRKRVDIIGVDYAGGQTNRRSAARRSG